MCQIKRVKTFLRSRLMLQKLFLGLGQSCSRHVLTWRHLTSCRIADLRPQDDYVVCIIGGRKELFGHDDARLRALRSEELQALSVDLLKDWPETCAGNSGPWRSDIIFLR